LKQHAGRVMHAGPCTQQQSAATTASSSHTATTAAAGSSSCWQLLLLLAAADAAASSCCCWLLLRISQQQQPAVAAAGSQPLLASGSSSSSQHACRFMHAGSLMHACLLLMMRACVRRAYCKKCRVHLALERVGRSNIPVLMSRARQTGNISTRVSQISGQPFSPRSIRACAVKS
jgi:hypothetical protein